MNNSENHGNERLTKVETEVAGIREEMSGMWRTLKDIQDAVSRANKTDWQTIFAGLLVVGALYASSIKPLESKIEREQSDRVENSAREREDRVSLAEAVKVSDDRITELRIEMERCKDKLDTNQKH